MKNYLLLWSALILLIGSMIFISCEDKDDKRKPESKPVKLKLIGVDNNGDKETLECTCPCSLTSTNGSTASCD